MADRTAALRQWLETDCGLSGVRLEPASGDASFRRYFRVFAPGEPARIAMDAPTDRERPQDFVRIAKRLAAIGVHVPSIDVQDTAQGFVLLEDLGNRLYLDILDDTNADRLYRDALSTLLTMQCRAPLDGLPRYDRDFLLREMRLFPEWLLQRHLGIALTGAEQELLEHSFDVLVDSALEQPMVFVHRDYHSRNLLETAAPTPGVLDFQDAVVGPVTYDLVSLLKDCYIAWPAARVDGWASVYFGKAVEAGVLQPEHEPLFRRWFDLMGAQRHLKAAGIFARLLHRDGKDGYLADIPRTLGYLPPLAGVYPELAELARFIDRRVLPACRSAPVRPAGA